MGWVARDPNRRHAAPMVRSAQGEFDDAFAAGSRAEATTRLGSGGDAAPWVVALLLAVPFLVACGQIQDLGHGSGSVAPGVDGGPRPIDGEGLTGEPSDTTQTLRGIWGARADQVFAVGDLGTIVRFDGLVWRAEEVPAGDNLVAIDGCSDHDIWAIGEVNLLHFDGSGWQATPHGFASDPRDIDCIDGEVWAVAGLEVHRILPTPGTWDRFDGVGYYSARAVYGAGADDIWIVTGNEASFVRRRGDAFEIAATGLGDSFNFADVDGSARDDIWAIVREARGEAQSVVAAHWNGRDWRAHPAPPPAGAVPIATWQLDDIWVAHPNQALAVGTIGVIFEWDGSRWNDRSLPTLLVPPYIQPSLHGAFGFTDGPIWIVGDSGTILRFR